jgi:hypothetical protein
MGLESTAMVCVAALHFAGKTDPYVGFDEGSPDGLDPLQIVRQMAQRGITLVELPPLVTSFMLTTNSSSSRANLLSVAIQ